MKSQTTIMLLVLALSVPLFSGCSSGPSERYTSPRIHGEAQRINLEEVQKAFWDTKGSDFKSWMSAFEKRVNEIFDSKEVVSIDANRQSGHLVVTGFIAKTDKDGLQPGDEKLFAIEQTGDAVNNEMPYRVSGVNGTPYYEGHHSILDNPIIQMMVFSHLMGGWGGRYYTPQPQVIVLGHQRDSYRNSPAYTQQEAANQGFFSRFKSKANGSDLESSKKFGASSFSSTSTDSSQKSRSWFGGKSTTSTGDSSSSAGTSSSGWGGRRAGSTGVRSFGGWGRRRR